MTDRELLELLVDKVTNMEQDFSGISTNISSLKTDVSSIKEEQRFMKQAIFELDTRSIATDQKIDVLTEQVLSNTKKLDDMRNTQRLVNDHDTDIRMIKKMLTQ